MRRLAKLDEPLLLKEKKEYWKQKVREVGSEYYKTKYRERSIKKILLEETHDKCVYCESKIGHNTPGDVEHKVPVSVKEEGRFEWRNLTIACTECNRRKNDYYDQEKPFINPYVDNVEDILIHMGPLVFHKPGEEIAEISVKVLEIGDIDKRKQLFSRKVDKLKTAMNLMNRIEKVANADLKEMLIKDLHDMGAIGSEYSAMVKTITEQTAGPWAAPATVESD